MRTALLHIQRLCAWSLIVSIGSTDSLFWPHRKDTAPSSGGASNWFGHVKTCTPTQLIRHQSLHRKMWTPMTAARLVEIVLRVYSIGVACRGIQVLLDLSLPLPHEAERNVNDLFILCSFCSFLSVHLNHSNNSKEWWKVTKKSKTISI